MVKTYWQALIWNLLVITVSLLPGSSIPETRFDQIPHLDKIVHFFMYAVLTFLILRKNPVFFRQKKALILWTWTFLYTFLTGFFLEILQNSFLIGRFFDIFDVLANTAGSLFAVLFYGMFHHLNKR